MAVDFWKNGPGQTIIDIQIAPGEVWRVLDVQSEMTAPSGGRQGVDSEWGRDASGNPTYLGHSRTGNPERYTFDVMSRLEIIKALQNTLNDLNAVRGCGCDEGGVNLRVRYRCGDIRDINNYVMAFNYIDSVSTSQTYANNMANASEGDNQTQMITESMSAGAQIAQRPLIHNDIKGTVTDTAINDIVWRCANEFYAVTDRDSSPGYVGHPTPQLLYTVDGGESWSEIDIAPFLDSDALSVVIYGANVLTCSSDDGVAYCNIERLKDGVGNPNLWGGATGLTAAKMPRVLGTTESKVWAAGTDGYVYVSNDGGFTFEIVNAGTVTTENLTAIAPFSDDLVWFAGENGALVRYYRGTLSLVTVSGVSGTINAVAVPDRRSGQVYIGTATGEIYRSKNALATTPVFVELGFPQSGSGSIEAIQFVEYRGQFMFVLQSDTDNNSRVLRDNSGGAMGASVEIIGDFQSPDNNGINAIAMQTPNQGLLAGEVVGGYGYIGALTS